MWTNICRKLSRYQTKINPLLSPNPGKGLYNGPVAVEFDHISSAEERE